MKRQCKEKWTGMERVGEKTPTRRGGKRARASEPVRRAKRADARARRAWGWFGPAKPTIRTGRTRKPTRRVGKRDRASEPASSLSVADVG